MRRFIATGLTIVLLSCSVVAQTKKASAKSTVPSKPTPPASIKYSTVEFDGTVKPGYTGHDARLLYTALAVRAAGIGLQKGEFETTADFQARVKAQTEKPLLGSIRRDSRLAFVFYTNEDYVGATVKYDADAQVLRVQLDPTMAYDGLNHTVNERAAFMWDTFDNEIRHFQASNVYGATVTVRQDVGTDVGFVFDKTNAKFLRRVSLEEDADSVAISHDAVAFSIRIPPEMARKLKDNVRVMLIGHLADPPFITGSRITKATITEPYEEHTEYHYLNLAIEDIWVFDTSDGVVLKKWSEQQ